MSSNENATSGDGLGNAKPSSSAIATADATSDDHVGNAKSKPSSSTTAAATTHLPNYRLLRPIYKRVLSMKAPEDVVKRAIQIYDLQEDKHPEEVVDEVEEMLGLKEIEWPAESVRLELIQQNLEVSITHVLRSYGRVSFFFYNIESLLMSLVGTDSLDTRVGMENPFSQSHLLLGNRRFLFPNGCEFHLSFMKSPYRQFCGAIRVSILGHEAATPCSINHKGLSAP